MRRTVLSAFSGAGGLDLGLEAAGFESVGCIEIDGAARESLARNRPSWPILEEGDINRLAGLQPPDLGLRKGELSLLAGGPPCQPFSSAGQWTKSGRNGLKDPRGAALRGFVGLARRFLPRAVLIENVPGFLTGPVNASQYLGRAFAQIRGPGGQRYRTFSCIVDAADYGVPQHRRRAIVLAILGKANWEWPAPSHKVPIRAFDALYGLKTFDPPKMSGGWAELLSSIPPGQNYQYHTPGAPGMPLFGRRTRYWSFLLKLDPAAPAWTLPAHPGPSTGPFHWENRPLAPAEMARLQSFPADWVFSGNSRAQVRQIGNATPPLLAEVLGRQIANILFAQKFKRPPLLEMRRVSASLPSVPVSQVPKRYRKLAADHASHPGTGLGPQPRAESAA